MFSESGLAYSADEILALSIMSKTPVLIVEGHDDVPVYERIADSVGFNCMVYASESIVDAQAGCEGVIGNIETIRSSAGNIKVEDYIIGFIDRDVRFFRGTLPSDPAIFVLNYYSIESHFVNSESLLYSVLRSTGVTPRYINFSFQKYFDNDFLDGLDFLFLTSLEALKNACEHGYCSLYGYADSIKSIMGRGLHRKVLEKADILFAYGEDKGLVSAWPGLLYVCKGKWLLDVFADLIVSFIKQLPEMCASGKVTKCQFCAREDFSKCLYKTTSFVSADIVKAQLFHYVDQPKLQYIKDRMKLLDRRSLH